MGASGRQVVRVWPEVVNPLDQAGLVELEEAQPRLRSLRASELDPARGAVGLANDPLDLEMPWTRKAFDVEPNVGVPAADAFSGLRALVDHVIGEQPAERVPVPRSRRTPAARRPIRLVADRAAETGR